MNKTKENNKVPSRRPCIAKIPWPVTPEMLVRSLKALHKSKLFGTYFTPVEVTLMVARKYPRVEQDPSLLLREVKDKLVCAAAADIIGYKIDSGYHLLTKRSRCVRIDTRSELLFWLLFKEITEKRIIKSKRFNKFNDRFRRRHCQN